MRISSDRDVVSPNGKPRYTAEDKYDLVVAALKSNVNGSGHSFECPTHPDGKRRFSVNLNEDKTRVLVNCHRPGCDALQDIEALGLDWNFITSPGDTAEPKGSGAPDENGSPGDYFTRDYQFVPPLLGRKAEQQGLLRPGPGGRLYRYDAGVYRPDGDDWLANFVRDELGDEFREHRLREVRAWVRANTRNAIPVEPTTDYVNTANGLLYWQDDPPRLKKHDPGIPSIIQIPVAWNPDAECPRILDFLTEALPDAACVDFLVEWFGYLLVPTTKFQRALMLAGPRDTGKSTVINIVEDFLGRDNVSAESLQSIADGRFTVANLFGKLGNVCADLDSKMLQTSGRFKKLVAGDLLAAERKFEHSFDFHPYTRLLFSANTPPGTSDQSSAYYKRWFVLPMRNQVPERRQDASLREALATPGELSGLLNLAVDGLRRLMHRGRFNVPQVMRDALASYQLETDTVTGFISDTYSVTGSRRDRVKRGVLYAGYERWCERNGKKSLAHAGFKKQLMENSKLVGEATVHGSQVYVGLARLDRDGDDRDA